MRWNESAVTFIASLKSEAKFPLFTAETQFHKQTGRSSLSLTRVQCHSVAELIPLDRELKDQPKRLKLLLAYPVAELIPLDRELKAVDS